jgi:secreted trypsin-like serine protease
MKKLLLPIILIFVVWVTPVAAITWGELDTVHTNVGAMVVDFPDFGPLQWCSGTLIHPRVFLTAGHCTAALNDFGITKVWVNFNQYALNQKTLLEVDEVITHPDFKKGSGNASNVHDVAVLILKEPVKKLKAAAVAEEGFLDDLEEAGLLREGSKEAQFTVVGYGVQERPGFAGEDKRRMAISKFQSLQDHWLHTSQNRAKGDSGSCFGDSGGPVFWTKADKSEVLVAIISWGDSQCVTLGFNYRIDTPETRSFIDDRIAELD